MPTNIQISSSDEDDSSSEDQTSQDSPKLKHIPIVDNSTDGSGEADAENVTDYKSANVVPINVQPSPEEEEKVSVVPLAVTDKASEETKPDAEDEAEPAAESDETDSQIGPDNIDDGDAVAPVGANIHIDNVNKSLWQYLWTKRRLELIIFVPVIIAWEILIIVVFIKFLSQQSNSTGNSSNAFGYLLILPFIVFGFWFYKLKKQFEATFLEQFARANNYSFDPTGSVDETYGSIFRLNGRPSVSDVVTGQYGNSALRLFLYELVVGHGRYQHTYNDTVIELDFHGELPELLMINAKSHYNQLNIAEAFNVKNKVELEGDFDKFLTLFAPKGNEVEALEVFSPDTMALMEDESKHYSVEFAGNRIYIYANGFVSTTENITQLFELAKQLIEKISPLADRLKSDPALMPTPINVLEIRRQPWLAKKIVLTFSISAIAFGLAITVIAIALHKPPTSTNGNTTASLTPTTYTINTSMPYCGAAPNSNTPKSTQQFLVAVTSYNEARLPISNELVDNNNQISNIILIQQINANQHFSAILKDITFPANAAQDESNLATDLTQYNSILTQMQKELPSISAATGTSVNQTLKNLDDSYSKLRNDMDLPASTCSFDEP